jgi:hypothetical protein
MIDNERLARINITTTYLCAYFEIDAVWTNKIDWLLLICNRISPRHGEIEYI